MVLFSLIILLLSNSITLRRDKSILYSRATITILLVSSLITYDGLNFLFLFYKWKARIVQLVEH